MWGRIFNKHFAPALWQISLICVRICHNFRSEPKNCVLCLSSGRYTVLPIVHSVDLCQDCAHLGTGRHWLTSMHLICWLVEWTLKKNWPSQQELRNPDKLMLTMNEFNDVSEVGIIIRRVVSLTLPGQFSNFLPNCSNSYRPASALWIYFLWLAEKRNCFFQFCLIRVLW